jgi:membrane protein
MQDGMALNLVKETFSSWMNDKAPRLGAALAYYAIFSIPPLLVIVISGISMFYEGDVSGVIGRELGSLIGGDAARTIIELSQQQSVSSGLVAGMLGVFVMLFGIMGFFSELQDAMNTIWGVQPKPGRDIRAIIRDRFLPFTMVLGIGFLLLVSMILTSVVSVVTSSISTWIPQAAFIGHALELALSFGVTTVLFAMMFNILPDVKIAWSDVWIGAAATAALFTIGKFLIGLYLVKGGIATTYGAAGSVIIMIVWVYYSSQILFLGAEFTKVYTTWKRPRIEPTEIAEAKPRTAA